MMKITAQVDFSFRKKFYKKDEDIKDILDIDTIVMLNERGYIKKLSQEELSNFEKDLKNNIKSKDINK